jgi:hypothetical protein
MTFDYDRLLERLASAGCPYKLYPARLRALELITGERHLAEVQKEITMRVALAGRDPLFKYQFQSDLETYGLLEAILYFNDYESLPDDFVEEACQVYERLAATYLRHHEEIVASDDPRIQSQLTIMRRFGDSSEHNLPRARRPPREAPDGIAPPSRPDPVAGYERRLLPHPDFVAILGASPTPLNLPEELLENIQASFMFEGFPGIQGAFFEVAGILDEHGVNVLGSEGQYVIAELVQSLKEEMFGDFERWIPCVECGEEFHVDLSRESVNASLLAGGWECESCRGSGSA